MKSEPEREWIGGPGLISYISVKSPIVNPPCFLFHFMAIRQHLAGTGTVEGAGNALGSLRVGLNGISKLGRTAAAKIVLRVTLVLVFLSCTRTNVSAAGFRAKGELTFWESTKAGSELRQTCRYEVANLGRQWRVSTYLTNGNTYVMGTDEASIFLLFMEANRPDLKTYPGVVSEGPYPLQSTTIFGTLPWLAFCSEDFFASLDRFPQKAMPAPWRIALSDPMAHIYSVQFSLLEGNPGLPLEVFFQPDPDLMADLARGSLRSLSFADSTQLSAAVSQLENYYGHIMEPEAIYSVSAITNFNGLRLPIQFSLDRFRFIKETNDVWKPHPYGSTRGVVLALESVTILDDPLPRAVGEVQHVSVADYRFFNPTSRVPFVRYVATNSAWIADRSDPFLQRIYQTYEAAAKSKRPANEQERYQNWMLLAVFLLFLATPFGLKSVRNYVFRFSR